MAALTSLPISLLSRIVSHLCDEQAITSRAKLHLTNDYIPNRHPPVSLTLDGVQNVNSPFPGELLAPALASPILAAAAQHFLRGRLSYLTDVNTEARLPSWVYAFSEHVEAIAIVDSGEEWRGSLSRELRKRMEEKLCREAVELCRTICVKRVRLKVLDLAKAPFDGCGGMQDELMTGLCTALEMCQSTLKELALPIFLGSDVCTRVLAMVTLPHLTVFSIELKNKRNGKRFTMDECMVVGRRFLCMMQAVDGHANRRKGLTSLQELRLINSYGAPFETVKASGCSAGFFRAIKTLRVTSGHHSYPSSLHVRLRFRDEVVLLPLFRELECFYRAGFWSFNIVSVLLCKRLKEMHLRRYASRTKVRDECEGNNVYDYFGSCAIIPLSEGKIRTLATDCLYSGLPRAIQDFCPNLQHLALHVSLERVDALGRLLRKCPRITSLQIVESVKDRFHKRMGNDEWLEMGRLIPGHANLRELEIRMGVLYGRGAQIAVLADCLVGIIKRIGGSVERLLVRLRAKLKTPTQALDALCRIMDCCTEYSRVLKHLDIDIVQEGRYSRCLPEEEFFELLESPGRLRLSTEKLVELQPCLNKIDLGNWQCFMRD